MGQMLNKVIARLDSAVSAGIRNSESDVLEYIRGELDIPSPPASRPGDKPHKVSGDLEKSVYANPDDDIFHLGSTSKYARALETGTHKMAARPWLITSIPAVAKIVKIHIGEAL